MKETIIIHNSEQKQQKFNRIKIINENKNQMKSLREINDEYETFSSLRFA